jgi:hypothetical protein
VGYFFHLEDPWLHAVLIGLIAGFLAMVFFLIIENDRPFMGDSSLTPASYQIVLDSLMNAQ